MYTLLEPSMLPTMLQSSERSCDDPALEVLDIYDEFGQNRTREQRLRSRNLWTIQVMKDYRMTRRLRCISLERLLDDWPLELLYEILKYLHPVDLHHLSYASEYFWSLLMSHNALGIWKEVFDWNSTVPPCPADIPYPQWTKLLFGSVLCQDCNDPGRSAQLDFHLRRRLCFECFYVHRENGMSELREYMDCDEELRLSRNKQIQHLADIWALVWDWGDLDIDETDMADLNGDEALIIGARAKILSNPDTRDIISFLDDCAERGRVWNSYIAQKANDLDVMLDTIFYSKVKTRFLRLGYENEVIDAAFMSKRALRGYYPRLLVSEGNPLRTLRREWRRIISVLKPTVEQERDAYLHETYNRRWLTAKSQYEKYIVSLPAETKNVLPKIHEVTYSRPLASLIYSQSLKIDQESFKQLVINFVTEWPPKTIRELDEVLPLAHVPHPRSACWQIESMTSAELIITCLGCREASLHLGDHSARRWSIFGWRAAVDHRARGLSKSCQFEISERGCAAAISLLRTLSLDDHTTPQDLSKLETSFSCARCMGILPPMRFDQCVLHFVETGNDGRHAVPMWKVSCAEER